MHVHRFASRTVDPAQWSRNTQSLPTSCSRNQLSGSAQWPVIGFSHRQILSCGFDHRQVRRWSWADRTALQMDQPEPPYRGHFATPRRRICDSGLDRGEGLSAGDDGVAWRGWLVTHLIPPNEKSMNRIPLVFSFNAFSKEFLHQLFTDIDARNSPGDRPNLLLKIG